jgi:hypothetical protein
LVNCYALKAAGGASTIKRSRDTLPDLGIPTIGPAPTSPAAHALLLAANEAWLTLTPDPRLAGFDVDEDSELI